MNNIITIINELKSTNSTKEKEIILKNNSNNELLKKILEYTYNPFKKYGITEKVFNAKTEGTGKVFNDIFELLDILEKSNINDILRNTCRELVASLSEEEQEIAIGILSKNLKIGISPTTINKVWKKLIPSFGVQLAANYKHHQPTEGEEIFITEKLDGIRCAMIYKNGQINFFSRQGKEITGLIDIEEDIKAVCEELGYTEIVFDGELLKENKNDLGSGDLYRETTSIVNSKSEYKKEINFNIFDIIPLQEFTDGKSKKVYKERRKELEKIDKVATNTLIIIPLLYQGTDLTKIPYYLKEMESQNKEGIMVNRNTVYEVKRSKGILKVKSMETCDVKVLSLEEGSGQNKGTLGNILIEFEHENTKYTCNVGSGFSKEERDLYWNNKELLLNKIVEIQYFEISKSLNGNISLRFPVWIGRIRNDKNEISMH